jgi:hypothetical protein
MPADRLEVVPDLEQGLDRALALTPPDGTVPVLPTYTAILALRRVTADRGLVRPYWEREERFDELVGGRPERTP